MSRSKGEERLSQQVMIEELTKEIYNAIEKFNDALPLASVVGILEVIQYELITSTGDDDE